MNKLSFTAFTANPNAVVPVLYLKLWHHCFLPHPMQFSIHWLSDRSMLHVSL